jgi:hypothetical protein
MTTGTIVAIIVGIMENQIIMGPEISGIFRDVSLQANRDLRDILTGHPAMGPKHQQALETILQTRETDWEASKFSAVLA